MSGSSSPRRWGSDGRRRATSKRAAPSSSACRRATASSRAAPAARRPRSHSRDSGSRWAFAGEGATALECTTAGVSGAPHDELVSAGPRSLPIPAPPRRPVDCRRGGADGRRAGADRAVRDGDRRSRLRAAQPAGGREGGALRALLALAEIAAAALPRRVPPRERRRRGSARRRSACGRSEQLFQRVLADYGDDSVAQLGGAHLAVEGASNLLTKALEWGRLMATSSSRRATSRTPSRGGALALRRARRSWTAQPPPRPLRRVARRGFETYARAAGARSRSCEQRPPRRRGRRRGRVPRDAFGPRRSTRCAGCCRRRRAPTSASSAPARRTSRCSCTSAPIRWRRRAPAPRR